MPPQPLPKPHYLRYAALSSLLAGVILFVMPYVLHFFFGDEAGGFKVDQLNSFAMAATLFWLVLQLGYLGYRALFFRMRSYQGESLEEQGKLFENVTDELRKPLFPAAEVVESLDISQAQTLNILTERRKVAQFTFLVRCVRLSFCLLVLFALLHLAQWAVTVGMGLKPGGLL